MDVGQIVSISIIVSLVVTGLYFVQRGARRGIVKAAMTTGNIVLSAFLACFLSRDFTTIARDYVYPLLLFILRLAGVGDLEQKLADYQGLIDLLPLFLSVLITPFLFLAFFAIFRGIIGFILMFVYRPSRKSVDEEGKKVKIKRHVPLWSRIGGAAVGVLNAFLLVAVLMLPFSGYANLTVNVAEEYYSEIDTSGYTGEGSSAAEQIYTALDAYVVPVTENWFLKASYSTFGRPMFNHMTSTAFGKSAFNLENEAIVGIRLLRSGMRFISGGLTNLGADSVEGLHEVVDTLGESVLMPELAAAFVAQMSDKWANGGDIFGIERPDFGELLDPAFDVLLGILATADGEVLVQDLNTLLDVLDLLVENGFFGNHKDAEQLAGVFGNNPNLLSDLMALFEQNDHLAPMAAEIKSMCVRAIAGALDLDNTELTGDLTESVNTYKDDPALLSKQLASIMQAYLEEQGIATEVGTDAVDDVAQAICDEFADRDYVTETEVIDFIMNYTSGNFTKDEIGAIVPGYGE